MPNQPKTPARTIRVDDETWDAVQAEAKRTGRTASAVVRAVLHKVLVAAVVGLVLGVGTQGAMDLDAAAAAPGARMHATAQDAAAFDVMIAGQVAQHSQGHVCWEPGTREGVIPSTVLVRGMKPGQGMGVVRALTLDEGWAQAKAQRIWILKACA